jgi:hypothetical protein
VGIPLEQLEPGAVVKIPDIFKALGYDSASAIYAGGSQKDPNGHRVHFALTYKGQLARYPWPSGPDGYPAPMPAEFELVEDKKLQELRQAQLAKGQWQTLPTYYSTGTDPEFFVTNDKGEVIPARNFLGSKKQSPTMFFDGLQAEITTRAGYTCLEVLSNDILGGLHKVDSLAKRSDKTARLVATNSFKFTKEQMAGFSDEDVRFRCSSSLNIYDDMGEIVEARDYPWRFAGGHIHIGCNARSAPVIKAMVRALDGIVGVAGVSLARNWDTAERRRMYGRAGEFRLPKHGLEYRVLSNFWLCSPLIYHLVFELTRYAYRIGEAGAFDALYKGTEEEIRNCINRCDVGLATKLIEANAALYNHIFVAIPGWKNRPAKQAMETLRNGLEEVVDYPNNVIENWHYDKSGRGYPPTWGRTFA